MSYVDSIGNQEERLGAEVDRIFLNSHRSRQDLMTSTDEMAIAYQEAYKKWEESFNYYSALRRAA